MEDKERATLNAAIDHLDGHGICSAGPWLRSIEVLDLTESYHPNASGQSLGYLPLFSRAS
ncbi:hypothetical protein GTY54_47655 [Streptomyces sp. SID625]|nr:hypothetical protein [Streptomyces sp. SID625]